MKVYISASCYYKATGLKTLLHRRTKHRVSASWVNEPLLLPNNKLSPQEKQEKANRNIEDIRTADIFIMMDDYDMVPGGKHFELGFATAGQKHCFVLGKHEHLYTWLNQIKVCYDLETLIKELKYLKD